MKCLNQYFLFLASKILDDNVKFANKNHIQCIISYDTNEIILQCTSTWPSYNLQYFHSRSTLTGIPKVKRDKYSVFTFLNFPSHEPVEEDTSSLGGEMKALPAPEAKPGESTNTQQRILQNSLLMFIHAIQKALHF